MSPTEEIINFIKENYPSGKFVDLNHLRDSMEMDYAVFNNAIKTLENEHSIEIDETTYITQRIRLL